MPDRIGVPASTPAHPAPIPTDSDPCPDEALRRVQGTPPALRPSDASPGLQAARRRLNDLYGR